MTGRRESALEAFIGVWGDGELADDIGPKLACGEVDVLADLFTATDEAEIAEMWLDSHARGDDEGDLHFARKKTEEPA